VTTIGIQAFADDNFLTSISIGSGVISIGASAFDGLGLTNIWVNPANPAYSSQDGVLFDKSQTLLLQYPASKQSMSYTFPGTVTSIAYNAFYCATNLVSVTIDKGVTNLEESAFDECTSLTAVYFQGNAPAISSFQFSGSDHLTAYYLPGTTGWAKFSSVSGIPCEELLMQNPLILTNSPVFGAQTNGFSFAISWISNRSVVVECCTDLAQSAWTPLQTNACSNGLGYFNDPAWTNYPRRFYRVSAP
jgi:hypothetical protein